MNEPYNRVHKQEDSNSTLGLYAKHIGIGLATSAGIEGGSVLGAKHIKNETLNQVFHNTAYAKPEGKYMSYLGAGAATKKGRMVSYGSAIAGGILTAALSSNLPKE